MDDFENIVVRFYDNNIVLSKDERTKLHDYMINFTENIKNIDRTFQMLKIKPDRNEVVYSFAADALYKLLCKYFSEIPQHIITNMREEMMRTLLEFGKIPNSHSVSNRLLICIAAYAVRTTDSWPNSMTDVFRTFFTEAKNQEWIFKFFKYIAEEYVELKENRTAVYQVLSKSNDNVIRFVADALPSLPIASLSDHAIKCLEVWTIKFEIDDPTLIDVIIEALLLSMTRSHQSEYAEASLCRIFEQPIYEKSDNLFQMLFHEMFGNLQLIIEEELKERNQVEHLKNIFLLFLKMGISHFHILYSMDETVLSRVSTCYFDIIIRCTPLCLKSIDSNLIFNFWTKIFTEKGPQDIETILNEVCIVVTKQLTSFAQYSSNFDQLDDEEVEIFMEYREALASSLFVFYSQIRSKIFDFIIELVKQADNAYNQNHSDWPFILELGIFLYTGIGANVTQGNPEIAILFNAITAIPLDRLTCFPPIFSTILSFLEKYSHLLNDDINKNRMMFNLIAGIMKNGNSDLVRKSMYTLNSLNKNGFEYIEPFLSEVNILFNDAINHSQFSLELKVELCGSLCHLVSDSSNNIAADSMNLVISPFLTDLKNRSDFSKNPYEKALLLLKLYARIFEKMNNSNFIPQLFDLYSHIDKDVMDFVEEFKEKDEILESIVLCAQAYLLNVGLAAEEHFPRIARMYVIIYKINLIPQVIRSTRILLCRFNNNVQFQKVLVEIVYLTEESFKTDFGNNPELIDVFFEEIANIIRKGACCLQIDSWSSLLGFSARAIQLNEHKPAKSAAFFIRTFVSAIEKDQTINEVFQKHFQQLVDILFKILINPKSFSGSIDCVVEIFFLFKKSYSANFMIAVKNCLEPIKPEEKKKFQTIITSCNSKLFMKQIVENFARAHQI